MMNSEFRNLPSVDQVLAHENIRHLVESHGYPHSLLVSLARESLDSARRAIAGGSLSPALGEIVETVAGQLLTLETPRLRPVINASGVLLHTNLGRAPLSQEATKAMTVVAADYSNLEFDLRSGRRGSRHVHVEDILCQLTGAEAALVVNNNASGVMLGLTALARRKEVVVSRGQAVEIGGSFRIPDVMRQSGAKLVEVGTTNCTYAADYEQAITPRTAALMRVHSSNFRLVGFVSEATLEDIVDVGSRNNVTVLDDLGSGCFLDTTEFGLDSEPMVQQSVVAGVGVTFFSGDKLVGGPQAGIIVGQKQLVDKLKRHPMARAVRIDKIRLAALIATLVHYLKGEATRKIPVWRMIATPMGEIGRRAELWSQTLDGFGEVIDGETMVGGGSLPGGTLPTKLVAIGEQGKRKKGVNISQIISARLRDMPVPIIGRISEDRLLLDPRSVLPEDDATILAALQNVAADLKKGR
ncbi:MAG: L-seryl-tRNA(Sec) selenium transferase [Dehalococcoidales bacterium]|nr:MAG: L-seryl-tRNA(Sec) selenium transferase [Dehalococcoidales bacterium]